jgi:hypothetical protein
MEKDNANLELLTSTQNVLVPSEVSPATDGADALSSGLMVSHHELDIAMKKASTAYLSARDNAANAAATVYYIWFHACSKHANVQNKEWYQGKRAARLAEISNWNANIETNKTKEEDDNKKKVEALRASTQGINDPDRIKEVDKQIQAQQKASKERLRTLTGKRKVGLETRSDATDFTEITKLVLDLHKLKQASQVNRFATVVKWIATYYAKEAQPRVEIIAERILEEGGFDSVYEQQRSIDGKPSKTRSAANPAAGSASGDNGLRKPIIAHFRDVVARADALTTLPLQRTRELNSLVVLIGRVGDNSVNVISEVGMPVEQVLDLCVAHGDEMLLPGDASCEFLATALAAGKLVEEGNRASKGGEIKKITRELSMLANTDGSRLVISALNTAVSVVVHATPKQAVSGLLPRTGWWKLNHADVEQLEQRLEDGIARKMVTLRVNATPREVTENLLPSPFAWETRSGPLATEGDAAATLLHPWLKMSPREDNPLDVEGFSPLGTVTLTQEDLLALAKGRIANWLTSNTRSAGDKKSALATVTISRSEVKVESIEEPDVVPCQGNVRGTVSLRFRPRMLAKAFATLAELGTGYVQLSPDQRGALRMSFEDIRGSYNIFLPACDEEGALEKARFCKIAVPETDGD